jgi:hypothetical protein
VRWQRQWTTVTKPAFSGARRSLPKSLENLQEKYAELSRLHPRMVQPHAQVPLKVQKRFYAPWIFI